MAHEERPSVGPQEQEAFEAWRLLLRTHAVLVDGLGAALQDGADLSLPAYDLLAQLAAAPDRRLLMHDLERRVLFSQSTVSRLAARLERAGLLERAVPPSDRRAVEVRLTAAGWRTFRSGRAVATRFLQERFVGPLGPARAAALLDALRALAAPPPAVPGEE